MEHRITGIALTVISAIIFGAMPLMTKSLYALGANAVSLPFFRAAITTLILSVARFYFNMVFASSAHKAPPSSAHLNP